MFDSDCRLQNARYGELYHLKIATESDVVRIDDLRAGRAHFVECVGEIDRRQLVQVGIVGACRQIEGTILGTSRADVALARRPMSNRRMVRSSHISCCDELI